MSDNSTSARILMKAIGETFKVTGLTITTSSTLYVLKYVTGAGCSFVEYVPYIFNQNKDTNITFAEHMKSTNIGTWYAVGMTCIILAGGVVIRKVGTVLSDEKAISNVERLLYNTNTTNKK